MSRYLSQLLTILLLLSGCALKSPSPDRQSAFAQEQVYLLNALYAKEHGRYAVAHQWFQKLYQKTKEPLYRFEALKVLVAMRRYDIAQEELNALLPLMGEHLGLRRLAALIYLKNHQMDRAIEQAKFAYDHAPDVQQNVNLLASLYIAKDRPKAAYHLYETYYRKHHSRDMLLKMATLLSRQLGRQKEAIELLETHSKMVACDELICLYLIELYRANKELLHLADTYVRLYRHTRHSEYAKKAAQIYLYEKDYDKARRILEYSNVDHHLLLSIYKYTKAYDQASQLAQKLYKKTSDPVWLAEYAILCYEAAKKKSKIDPLLLKKVAKSLKEAIKKGVDDPIYYNYLGYLLIDYDLSIREGIHWVQKALAKEPDSAFYIDSLAWGYYKIGQCQKAYKTIKKVVEKIGLKDPEVRLHWRAINICRSQKK